MKVPAIEKERAKIIRKSPFWRRVEKDNKKGMDEVLNR